MLYCIPASVHQSWAGQTVALHLSGKGVDVSGYHRSEVSQCATILQEVLAAEETVQEPVEADIFDPAHEEALISAPDAPVAEEMHPILEEPAAEEAAEEEQALAIAEEVRSWLCLACAAKEPCTAVIALKPGGQRASSSLKKLLA
jgi:hypothetical protein